MEEDVKTIGDYLDTLKRRKWSLVLPIVILFVIAFVVALFYPRTYKIDLHHPHRGSGHPS